MGSDTRTLHIVTELLDIPMIQQDMVNATAYIEGTKHSTSTRFTGLEVPLSYTGRPPT